MVVQATAERASRDKARESVGLARRRSPSRRRLARQVKIVDVTERLTAQSRCARPGARPAMTESFPMKARTA